MMSSATAQHAQGTQPIRAWQIALYTFSIIAMLALSGALAFIEAVADHGDGSRSFELGRVVGSVFGAIALPMIILGLFQIGARFRFLRSRLRILFWSSLIFLVIALIRFAGGR